MIMKEKYRLLIIGIAAIVIIEIVALSNGIDGTALAGSMAAIGAIVGYAFRKPAKQE